MSFDRDRFDEDGTAYHHGFPILGRTGPLSAEDLEAVGPVRHCPPAMRLSSGFVLVDATMERGIIMDALEAQLAPGTAQLTQGLVFGVAH